jgi:hypothetical protein
VNNMQSQKKGILREENNLFGYGRFGGLDDPGVAGPGAG